MTGHRSSDEVFGIRTGIQDDMRPLDNRVDETFSACLISALWHCLVWRCYRLSSFLIVKAV